jgi:polyphosphate kinase
MFTTRNLFYLKISKDIVLPLYVYLDQQHVHWMSDYVLQRVLRDLKPLQVSTQAIFCIHTNSSFYLQVRSQNGTGR